MGWNRGWERRDFRCFTPSNPRGGRARDEGPYVSSTTFAEVALARTDAMPFFMAAVLL